METVQDLMMQDLFEEIDDTPGRNDMLDVLQFMRQAGVPLTGDQVQATFLLNEMGLGDIAVFMNGMKPHVTPRKTYFDTINKITLADRIKGNAKLSGLVKAQVASPNGVMPNSAEMEKMQREHRKAQREVNR